MTNIRNYAIHTVPETCLRWCLRYAGTCRPIGRRSSRGHGRSGAILPVVHAHDIGELFGSTMGIIGEGAIGRRPYHCSRLWHARAVCISSTSPKKKEVVLTPLDQVLAESDVLSLHCPLLPATRNLIGIEELRKMKRSVLLINTARGGLVDEAAALVQALEERVIAGETGFDVLTVEPPAISNPLLELRGPNFILTPHVAWAPAEAMQTLADQLIDNIEAWVAGRQNLVT